jgi:hypothetical protein
LTLFQTLTENGWKRIHSLNIKTFPSKVLPPSIPWSVTPHSLCNLLTAWKNVVTDGNTEICNCWNEPKK